MERCLSWKPNWLKTIFLILFSTLMIIGQAHAEDGKSDPSGIQTLPPVDVVDKKEPSTTITPSDSAVGTRETIDRATIAVQGGTEQINPYKAISMQPGVDIRFDDAFGMEVTHRIRGKSDRNIGETIEGLPVKGIGPGVGLSTMVDLENIQSISLSKGAVSADSGFGYGSDNGMVDMHVRRPTDEAHGTLKQALGSDAFTRTYLRVDTGQMGRVAKGFVSGSYTEADKWKGDGDSPDGRRNVAAGLSGTSDQTVGWEIYGIQNADKRHNYKGLDYEQRLDLSDNRLLLPATALIGATYLLLADNIARLLFSVEIPIGILTSLAGIPFFAFVLRKTRKGWN